MATGRSRSGHKNRHIFCFSLCHVTNVDLSPLNSPAIEPVSGSAMWGSEIDIVELNKGERGLGFSILDYQDPLDSNATVIVIRSLVPEGVAKQDGRLTPGKSILGWLWEGDGGECDLFT
jgi:hypothetical protein